ncbi:MAG: hypothetical protein OXH14_02070, partial [Alphaproteobacteria bacterium]|nr:hypothetical protein [Alphaproteobacteria bacterium]
DVKLTVAQSGDVAASGATGSRTVTVPTGGSIAVEVATDDDSTDEPDGSVSVTVKVGAGYAVASAQASATVAVRDNDDPSPDPEVSVSAGGAVTEGGKASFTVSASPAPSAPLDVTITVAQTGDVAASGATGSRTVTVPTSGSVAVEVATQDDSADEPDGSVSLTVKSGAGYAVSSAQSSATVTVRDNDDPAPDPETPTFSVDDATANESDGFIWFTVRLSAASDKLVTVRYRTRESTPVSARRNRDYLATNGTRTFAPNETAQRFRVRLYDDAHDEAPETFEVVLSDAQGATIADGVAVGTIVNTDPMPAAWLGRFGRAVAEQALDGIENRLEAHRGEAESAHAPGFRGTVGWLPVGSHRGAPSEVSTQPDASGAKAFGLQAGTFHGGGAPMTRESSADADLGQLLLGSQFAYTREQDANGGVLGFWGRGSQARFDAREGALGLDGEVTTAMLGADYARSNWLAGMALTQSRGSGGFRGSGAVADAPAMDGAIRTTLTAAIPYASWRPSERLDLWSAAGYGAGETTLETETAELLEAKIDWALAAAGLRSDLFTLPGGAAVAWVSDALWARTGSDRADGLAATDSSVSRLRLGVEGRRLFALSGGGSLALKLEIGARRDGGDAETGLGAEIGGGIAWTAPRLGLTLDLAGRTLVTHEDRAMRNRGFSAALAYDPAPDSRRGLSLSLRRDIGGPAADGLDALFANEPIARRVHGQDAERWTAEIGYGLPVFGGRFVGVPHLGYGISYGTREIGLGWRLAPEAHAGAPGLSLAIQAARRESLLMPADHRIGIEIRVRW